MPLYRVCEKRSSNAVAVLVLCLASALSIFFARYHRLIRNALIFIKRCRC